MANINNDFSIARGYISEDAFKVWKKLGYSVEHYIPLSEVREEGWWIVQFFYPKAETLYELDLINNKVRHRGLEVGCFWTEWEWII